MSTQITENDWYQTAFHHKAHYFKRVTTSQFQTVCGPVFISQDDLRDFQSQDKCSRCIKLLSSDDL